MKTDTEELAAGLRELADLMLKGSGNALMHYAADRLEELERELEQERQDRKQADLDTIRALGERNDARAEVAMLKARPCNDSRYVHETNFVDIRNHMPTPAEIDAHLDECVAKSAVSWKPLPGDLP